MSTECEVHQWKTILLSIAGGYLPDSGHSQLSRRLHVGDTGLTGSIEEAHPQSRSSAPKVPCCVDEKRTQSPVDYFDHPQQFVENFGLRHRSNVEVLTVRDDDSN